MSEEFTENETGEQICEVDFDDATYVGDGDDGCYFDTAEGPDGWYTTVTVDSDTGHFVEDLVVDDGPYPTKEEARRAGQSHAEDWCCNNEVRWEDEKEED